MRSAPVASQTEMEVSDPETLKKEHERVEKERERLAEYRQSLLERFFRACRDVCRELTYEKVANELEKDWGEVGRHVSSGVLKICLAVGNERNYFRWEWCTYFADASEECADVMAEISGRKSKKDPKDELRDLQNIIRAEYPKQADKHIRKAATP